jgi:hypothetical protein
VEVSPFVARPRRRRLWLLAAAVLVVAGVVAALALRRSTDEEGIVSDHSPAYLVPGWTPDGWHVQEARPVHASDFSDASIGTVTVYGDARLESPWTGPKLQAYRWPGRTFDPSPEGEPITIGGQEAFITGGSIWWMDGDDMVMVLGTGDGVDRSTVVTAAEALVGGDIIDGLPEGFERLASGPTSAMVGLNYQSVGQRAIEGFALSYGEAAPGTGQIVLLQQAGDHDDPDLVQLLGVGDPGAEPTDVRGLSGYQLGDQWFQWNALEWYEPSGGLVVTVFARDVDPSVLAQFVEGLRLAGPDEVDELRSRAEAGPFGKLEPGEVPVTEGEYPDGAPWRLAASDDGDGGFDLSFTDDAGTADVGFAEDSDPTVSDVRVGVADGGDPSEHDGMVAVFGVVPIQAGEVLVEAPGREPIPLTRYEALRIPGWSDSIFWGMVPADLGPAEVVARSGAELEFGRAPLDVGGGRGGG